MPLGALAVRLAVHDSPDGGLVGGDLGVDGGHALLEAFDDFGMLGGEVGCFGEVVGEVEEEGLFLPFLSELKEFPVVDADAGERSTAGVVDEFVSG